jgi:hypothetical protein
VNAVNAAEKVTVSEMIESLNGFEEIAITKAFDSDIFTLLNTAPTTAGRALVFIDRKRRGETDKEAKNAALTLTLKEVDEAFAEDEDEVFEEEPDTEQGKDDSPDE